MEKVVYVLMFMLVAPPILEYAGERAIHALAMLQCHWRHRDEEAEEVFAAGKEK